MSEQVIEKRGFERVFFTLEEGISATISKHGDEECNIGVTLLSVSRGGVSLMGNRYKLPPIGEGERLTLKDLQFPPPLGKLDTADITVAYVLDFEHNVRLSFGCYFTDVGGDLGDKIDEYVHFRLANLGFNP